MQKTVNVLKLELTIENHMTSKMESSSFPIDKLIALKKKIIEFLQPNSLICISNRKLMGNNDYFVLKLSKTSIELLESISIKRNEYQFNFETNTLTLNNKNITQTALHQFIDKINEISIDSNTNNYEIIET